MTNLDTYFASPKRVSREEILKIRQKVISFQTLEDIFEQLPHFLLLLTEDRQIVFCNHELLEYLSARDINEILGLRPGELLQCIHSQEMPAGCGTSQSCQYCGAAKALIEAQRTRTRKEHVCRILASKNNHTQHYTFNIVVYPYKIGGDYFYLFFLEDISEKERNQQLELTFLHDLGNLIGSLGGYIEAFPENDLNPEQHDFLENMRKINAYVSEELQAQREISFLNPENVPIAFSSIESYQFLQNCIEIMNDRFNSANIHLEIEQETDYFHITSDRKKMRRILINFLKNAIEASEPTETVTIGAKQEKNFFHFWVSNPKPIPQDIQAKLFQFGYSTKGRGHGLGLYSAKILTEDILKGEIGFISNEKMGTTFFAKFPKQA